MRGKVRGFNGAAGEGVITGDDGRRYPFSRTDLKAAPSIVPGKGIGIIAFFEGIIYLTMDDQKFYDTYAVGKKEWF